MRDPILVWATAMALGYIWCFCFPKWFPNWRFKERCPRGTVVIRGNTIIAADGTEYRSTGTFTYMDEDPATHPYLEKIDV